MCVISWFAYCDVLCDELNAYHFYTVYIELTGTKGHSKHKSDDSSSQHKTLRWMMCTGKTQHRWEKHDEEGKILIPKIKFVRLEAESGSNVIHPRSRRRKLQAYNGDLAGNHGERWWFGDVFFFVIGRENFSEWKPMPSSLTCASEYSFLRLMYRT